MNCDKYVIDEFMKLYNDGAGVAELCLRFNICKSTVYNWIRKYTPIRKPYRGRIITPADYRHLEREKQTLQVENEIFHRCGILSKITLDDKLAMIECLSADFFIHILCKTLGVLKSTYYHHKLRSPAKKWYEINDEVLRPLIKQIFIDSHERFGSRKIRFVLMQQGYTVSETHISRLMKEMDLVCKQVRLRYFSTTNRKYKYYRNKVQRKFITDAPNLIWVSDITHVYVKNIDYSICVIIDLYARKVIAYDIAEQANVEFILKIFDSAFEIRQRPTGLTFHSDQGTQYTAYKFRKHLRKLGVNQSFSNPGTPLDNAVAESFFACMKREELSHNYYVNSEDLRHDVSNYIDFFNNMRPHQRLGMQTPAGVEAQFMAEKN